LTEIEKFSTHIRDKIKEEYEIDISCLKPRAFILIGNSENWSQPKKDALRKLNYYLHNIKVITYKDLFDRGNQFIAINNSPI
jgi:hypothetical protein